MMNFKCDGHSPLMWAKKPSLPVHAHNTEEFMGLEDKKQQKISRFAGAIELSTRSEGNMPLSSHQSWFGPKNILRALRATLKSAQTETDRRSGFKRTSQMGRQRYYP
jgi:hypothetical protein